MGLERRNPSTIIRFVQSLARKSQTQIETDHHESRDILLIVSIINITGPNRHFIKSPKLMFVIKAQG